MPEIALPLLDARNLAFVLYEVLGCEDLTAYPRFAEHGRGTFDAALESARKLAERHFAPHNRKADLTEPRIEDGRAVLIPEIKAALDAFREAGFFAAHHDEDRGGMRLPWVVAQACMAQFYAANIATSAYPFLTIAAANLLDAFGTDDQKRRYMAPMLAGRFFGTMALSEPQAGSSLAEVRCEAEPLPDGRYRVRGSKMWTSGAGHDMADTIVHLVLARIRGAPPGVRGLSLFVVPDRRVESDGALGPDNDVALVGLNHKLGYRGTTNTVLSFGDRGECFGELVGEPNRGLACMFHMMNEARIVVGLGALALGSAGYLHSLDYARTRAQGREPAAKDPSAPPVPIVRHADVRRMLLAQKALVEGGLALALHAALLVDRQKHDPSPEVRRESGLLLDLLTPIVKAWGSEHALAANDLAIQVLGGYGYTRDHPVEQHWRDNRLNPIHEGTDGIQALDLLGRKVVMEDGAALRLFVREVRAARDATAGVPAVAACARGLERALDLAERTTARLVAARGEAGLNRALANAALYLNLLGHVAVAWMWLRQATVAARALERAEGPEAAFHLGKLQACRYFFRWELPRIEHWARLLDDLDPTCFDMDEAWF